jgi:hypothetical protein
MKHSFVCYELQNMRKSEILSEYSIILVSLKFIVLGLLIILVHLGLFGTALNSKSEFWALSTLLSHLSLEL